jgi:DNA-binding GntR family transcriptional regulator
VVAVTEGRRESTYTVLAREVRNRILQGDYADGRRLPTEAELAQRHRVSRQTVRRAFQDLVAEGLVYRVPGRGTFVTRRDGAYLRQFGSIDDLMGLSVDTRMDVTVPLRRQVDVAAASRLRLPDDVVHSVSFRRSHDGTPFCLTTVYVPPPVGAVLAAVPELTGAGSSSEMTIIALLDALLDAPIAEADQSITVAPADPRTAVQLGCAAGGPLLRIDRLYSDTAGRPVELAISHFLPQLYSYRTKLRRDRHA